jgi:divalent metal cation (Fe/Co/Zn/Cd) transporter
VTEVHATHAHVRAGRAAALRRAVVLNRLTLGWNAAEAVVALGAGLAAGSIGLVAFGLDSTVEVSASAILAWRLAQERRGGCSQDADRKAQRAIAASFAVLALYVSVDAGRDLLAAERPDATPVGIALAAVSLVVMPFLARAKRRLAPALGSRAQESEARQTSLCAVMSAVLLVGLALNALLGWWWADPVAALGIGVLAAGEARRAWMADSLEDTCC